MKITEREHIQDLGDHSITYWRNGSTRIDVFPDLKDPGNSKPFIVRIRGEHYIPVNELVYGADENEAKERLLAGLRWCAGHDYHESDGNPYLQHRSIEYLKRLKNKTMWIEIEPLDITSIVSVEWCA